MRLAVRNRIELLLCLGCLIGSSADAAEVTELEMITSYGAKTAQEMRRLAPNAQIVIDREEIEKFSNRGIGDVLRRLPGVVFGGPPGESKDVRLRGLDKEYTQVLIDGRRVPGAGEKREFQVDRLPADLVERIEIIRTPTADVDSQGIAGTINIVLRKAPSRPTLGLTLGGTILENVGVRPNAALTYGGALDGFRYLLSVEAQQRLLHKDKLKASAKADGTPDKSEREAETKELDEVSFAPRLRWDLSKNDHLEFDPWLLFSDEDKKKRKLKFKGTGTPDGREEEREGKTRVGWAARGTWEHDFGENARMALGVAVQGNEEDKHKNRFFFKPNGNLDKTETEDEDKSDREIVLTLSGRARVGDRHALKAGLEFIDKDREKRKRKLENKQGMITDKSGAKDSFDFDEQRVNFYLLDEFSLGARHVFTPGLRVEWTRSSGKIASAPRDWQSEIDWNPSLHYVFRWSARTNLRASVARTVRRPKFDDLVPFVDAKDGTLSKPDKVGNPDLDRERATGLELGVEHFFSKGGGTLGLAGFYRKIEDKIETQVRLSPASGRFEEMPVSVGDGKLFGLELDARRRMDFAGLPGLTVHGNFSLLGSEIRDPVTGRKRQFKEQPDQVLNVGFDYDLPSWGLGLGANFNWISEREKDEVKGGKRTLEVLQPESRLGLYAVKKLGKGLELRLSAENLLEAEKRKKRTIFKPDGSLEKTERDVEGSKRAFFVTLRAQW